MSKALVSFLLLASASLAGCTGPQVNARGGTMDGSGLCLLAPLSHNPDGSVTRADVDMGIKAGFAQADTNADGVLDMQETARLNDAKAASCDATAYIDYSGRGVITPEAFGARYLTAFAQADYNQDGIATAEELQYSARKLPKKRTSAQ